MERIYKKIGRIREYAKQVRSMEADCLPHLSRSSRLFHCFFNTMDATNSINLFLLSRISRFSRLPRFLRYTVLN